MLVADAMRRVIFLFSISVVGDSQFGNASNSCKVHHALTTNGAKYIELVRDALPKCDILLISSTHTYHSGSPHHSIRVDEKSVFSHESIHAYKEQKYRAINTEHPIKRMNERMDKNEVNYSQRKMKLDNGL